MGLNDIINGSFELIAGLLSLINIFRLIKDKQVKGVSWMPTSFFTLWGAWNLYYYPSINQPFSFIGGLSIFATNVIWISLVFYYKYQWSCINNYCAGVRREGEMCNLEKCTFPYCRRIGDKNYKK